MKTLILALILALSLVFITDAYRLQANNALQEQLLDYLIETERQNLIDQRGLRKQLQRYEEDNSNDEESNNDDDSYERTYARRKAVGLGDNPFK